MPEIIEVKSVRVIQEGASWQTVLSVVKMIATKPGFGKQPVAVIFETNRERHGLWPLVANAQKERKDQEVVLPDIFFPQFKAGKKEEDFREAQLVDDPEVTTRYIRDNILPRLQSEKTQKILCPVNITIDRFGRSSHYLLMTLERAAGQWQLHLYDSWDGDQRTPEMEYKHELRKRRFANLAQYIGAVFGTQVLYDDERYYHNVIIQPDGNSCGAFMTLMGFYITHGCRMPHGLFPTKVELSGKYYPGPRGTAVLIAWLLLQDVNAHDIYSLAPGQVRVSVSEVMVVDIKSNLSITTAELLQLHAEYSRARIVKEEVLPDPFSVAAPRLPAGLEVDGDDPELQAAIAASLKSAGVQGAQHASLGGGGPSAFVPAVPAAQRGSADGQFPRAPGTQAPDASLFKPIMPPPAAQPTGQRPAPAAEHPTAPLLQPKPPEPKSSGCCCLIL